MAPQEVAGLAALAKANGTSLTINPQTGLPEAFKIKALLPTILGFGISALTGGAVQPWMIGLGVGGVEAARTGSLQKGFMAGLGAYGGAGLGASVMGAGTSALQTANSMPAATTTAPMATAVAPQAAAPAMTAIPEAVTTAAAPSAAMAGDVAIQAAAPKTTTLAPVIDRSIYPAGETASTGLKSLVKDPSPLMNKQNLGYALAALSSMSGAEQSTAAPYKGTQPTYESVYDPETGRFIRVPVGTRAKQESTTGFFKPNMRVAGSEGVRAAAAGGTIEDMSSRNHMEMLLANGGQSFAAGGDTTGMRRVFDPMTGLVTYEPDPSYAPVKTVTKMPQMPSLGQEGPGSDPITPSNPANALTGPNGSLNAVAQTLSNLGQSLGITGPGQGYSVLGLPGAVIGNAVAMDPTNVNSINAQNAMDVGANPALGFGSGLPSISNANNNNSLTNGLLNFSGTQPDAPVDIAVPTISNAQAAQMMADEVNASLALSAPAAAPPEATTVGKGMAPAATPAAPTQVGGPIAGGVPAGTGLGMLDANIGIDPTGMGGIDPGVAADVAAATAAGIDAGIDPGEFARGGLSSLAGYARGGSSLGDYSDGGRLLRGPGDGVSDSIPASIANKRPARLADGEFVVPARIVSELGNGSTEAGARKLYAMMDRIQRARRKTTGKGKVAVNSRAEKLLPA
jgi:hypothetical protein